MKKKEWITIIILIIVIAAVVAWITGSITGNVIKLNEDKWGKYQAYTKAEVDAKLVGIPNQVSINYLDPTSCQFKIATPNYNESSEYTNLQCESTQVISMITHIDCPSFRYNRAIISTGWNTGSLPNSIAYTCIDPTTEAWIAPTQVFGYCCDIKTTVNSGGIVSGTEVALSGLAEKTIKSPKKGKSTVS